MSLHFPPGYRLIDLARHETILGAAYNPISGDKELRGVLVELREYFHALGEYGSDERYQNGEESDWWINDDGFTDSRSVGVDILNPQLLSFQVIEGVRSILATLTESWMVFLFHNNRFNAKGQYVGEEGEFFIWITLEQVEIYSLRTADIANLMASFPTSGDS